MADNMMCKILNKNTQIPCINKYYFTTSEDITNEIEIKIFQGENIYTYDNFLLGILKLENIKPDLQGKTIIVITISVSTDGLIRIEGKIKNTDIEKKIIINRYDYILDDAIIEKNKHEYEMNDTLFGTIMSKYYILITMLNKLKYNLIDNCTFTLNDDFIFNSINLFWDDLIYLYNILNSSNNYKNNINTLYNLILNISTKLNLKTDFFIISIESKNILLIFNNLITNLEKNFKHYVTTFQNYNDI